MNKGISLGRIPDGKYADYRTDVIFSAYKWDPQVGDYNTVSHNAVLLSRDTAARLEAWAEQLSRETAAMEAALQKNPSLAKKLGIPSKILKAYKNSDFHAESSVRLMRFDFHPTTEGWSISEVNSDVPGGLAEASVLPEIAAPFFDGYGPAKNTASQLLAAFKSRLTKGEDCPVALVHATAYSDDRQVMQFLSDYFEDGGLKTVLAAPDHIKWINNEAYCAAQGCEGKIGGIIRFYPLEWLPLLPSKSDWKGYFSCVTPSCNHPSALLTQSKRLPLIWDGLFADIPAWKALLPETARVTRSKIKEGFIFKPALGRVGEGISIKEAVSGKEFSKTLKHALRHKKHWVAQRKFNSLPLFCGDDPPKHLCIGVFTVDGKSAGFYGRISGVPRIDSRAEDIPVLVCKE